MLFITARRNFNRKPHRRQMNTLSAPPVIRRPSPHRWLWLFLTLIAISFLMIGTVVYGVTSFFRLSSDTRAMRNSLVRSSGGEWDQRIALNVGSLTLGAARTGLSFADLPPEARAAIQTVRGAEVGIYQLSSEEQPDPAAMLASADKAMTARGWYRVVGVIAEGKLVTVYMPEDMTSARRMKCCVMVCDGENMVIASANANLQPLINCAFKEHGLREKIQEFAKR